MTKIKEIFCIPSSKDNEQVLTAWRPDGDALAVAKTSGNVQIFDKIGRQSSNISLDAIISDVSYSDSNALAILTESGKIVLWTSDKAEPTHINTQFKGATKVIWSDFGVVAVVTRGGNVSLVDTEAGDKAIQIAGKHTGPITSALWMSSKDDSGYPQSILCLGGKDRVVSMSNELGDTMGLVELDDEPTSLGTITSNDQTFLLINKSGKSLILYSLSQKKIVNEYTFEAAIVHQEVIPNGGILLALRNAHLACINVDGNSYQKPLMIKVPLKSISAAAFEFDSNITIAENNLIFVYAYADTQKLSLQSEPIFKAKLMDQVQRLEICTATKMLLAVTVSNQVYGFAAVESSTLSYNDQTSAVAFVPSLMTVEIHTQIQTFQYNLEFNPSLLGIGGKFFAAANGNRLVICELSRGNVVHDIKVGSEIKGLFVNNNDYLAVNFNNSIDIFSVEGSSMEKIGLHPNDETNQSEVTASSLASSFLAYSTGCNLKLFSLKAQRPVSIGVQDHKCPIQNIVVSSFGDIFFQDSQNDVWLYDLAAVGPMLVGRFSQYSRVICEHSRTDIFHICTNGVITSFCYKRRSHRGPNIAALGILAFEANGTTNVTAKNFSIDDDCIPFAIDNGAIHAYSTRDCCPKAFHLPKHLDTSIGGGFFGTDELREKFASSLSTLEIDKACELAFKLCDDLCILALAYKALEILNVRVAIHAFRYLGCAADVHELEKILLIEEESILSKYIDDFFRQKNIDV